jgi:DNA-directed RNA polymerase delta subunit
LIQIVNNFQIMHDDAENERRRKEEEEVKKDKDFDFENDTLDKTDVDIKQQTREKSVSLDIKQDKVVQI